MPPLAPVMRQTWPAKSLRSDIRLLHRQHDLDEFIWTPPRVRVRRRARRQRSRVEQAMGLRLDSDEPGRLQETCPAVGVAARKADAAAHDVGEVDARGRLTKSDEAHISPVGRVLDGGGPGRGGA